MASLPVPQAIRRGDREIEISWTDDHRAGYPARYLRLRCHCAQCEDEFTGRPRLDPASVPEDVAPVTVDLVGTYAIRIRWSDGHNTGIYPYEYLLEICPCDRCAARRRAAGGQGA